MGNLFNGPIDIFNLSGCPKCYASKGETKIQHYLDQQKIQYIREKTYASCCSPKGYRLRYDFYLPEYDILIEYDGQQHFVPTSIRGQTDPQETFNRTVIHDRIKNDYADTHNIRLLRIPYFKFYEIDQLLISALK